MHQLYQSITPVRVLWAFMLIVFVFLAATRGLIPEATPDTGGYLEPWARESLWDWKRTPLLGFLLAPFGGNFTLLPAIVIGLFFVTVDRLYRAAVRYGVSEFAALALTLPLILSNTFLRYSRQIASDVPATILLLVALVLVVQLQHEANRRPWRYIAFTLALGSAYVIRPALLPFVVAMPLLAAALGYLRTQRWQLRFTFLLLALSAAPFLTVSTIRHYVVGDFNTVSFGGFTMAGMAASMLSDDIVAKLPERDRPFARSVLEKRNAMMATGQLQPMVINMDTNQRDYRRTARSFFDIVAVNSVRLMWDVVRFERRPDENWVQFDQRMMQFALDVIRADPKAYAMWIVGGTRNFVGTATVHNFPFVVGLSALLVLYFSLVFSGRAPAMHFQSLDLQVLVLVTLAFVIGAGLFTILLTFPVTRYVSLSAIFVPSLPFYFLIHLCFRSRERVAGLS